MEHGAMIGAILLEGKNQKQGLHKMNEDEYYRTMELPGFILAFSKYFKAIWAGLCAVSRIRISIQLQRQACEV